MSSLPKRFHNKIVQQYPNMLEMYDGFIKDKGGQIGDWPDWCYMPMAAAAAVASKGNSYPDDPRDISAIAAVAAWRPHRAVVDLRDTSLEELQSMTIPDPIGLQHFDLPLWCPFVQISDDFGAFIHLEYDINDDHAEFRAVPVEDDLSHIPVVLDLKGDLAESARSVLQEAYDVGGIQVELGDTDLIRSQAETYLPLALYLTRENWQPEPPTPRRTIKAARKNTLYTVGS